ncbi:hypothetical protein FBU30_000505 [Linnemannia zychae]|nr:hypothetical protein FBU30_000505 [Linnemannia zychae]
MTHFHFLQAYIFGGEFQPRIPVDSNLYVYDLKEKSIKVIAPNDSTPSSRVGATLSSIGSKIYLFGGRGGKDMTPLQSALYSFDTESNVWEVVKAKSGELPAPRSFHAMTASDSDIYVFGGCPTSGRLNDMHKFSLTTGAWSVLPTPPITPRGGAAMAYHGNRLYLHGGFTGKEESDLVVYDNSSGEWTHALPSSTNAPEARSVHAIVPIASDSADLDRLLILFGEGNPSKVGHEGAGEFWGDIWTATLPKSLQGGPGGKLFVNYEKMSLAAFRDDQGNLPCPRGWFQASPWNGNIVLSGGLAANNKRLDDIYLLSLE